MLRPSVRNYTECVTRGFLAAPCRSFTLSPFSTFFSTPQVRLSHAVGVNAALARERDALLERVEPLAHLSNPTEADSAVLERESIALATLTRGAAK